LWSDADLGALVPPAGMLLVDGAYCDFSDRPPRAEMLSGTDGKRIILTRTVSKSYSLAGIRFGYAIAHPDVIAGLRKVKDSYNCNTLTLAAAAAALEDQAWMRQNVEKIRATCARLTAALRGMGFHVVDSQANFVWATRAEGAHHAIYEALKARKILVRYMRFPGAAEDGTGELDGLRITVGTDNEIASFLQTLGEILGTASISAAAR
jgi:histidinol-phosphate aminotransferase